MKKLILSRSSRICFAAFIFFSFNSSYGAMKKTRDYHPFTKRIKLSKQTEKMIYKELVKKKLLKEEVNVIVACKKTKSKKSPLNCESLAIQTLN